MPSAERLAQHPARRLREPVVDGREDREDQRADEDVVEVRDQELEEEADAEEHRYAEAELAAPDGPEPVEDLYAGGDADQHRRGGEEDVAGWRHPDAEHVVRPHAEADEADRTRGGDHYLVAEDHLPREDRDDLGREGESGDHEDVDLRVTE